MIRSLRSTRPFDAICLAAMFAILACGDPGGDGGGERVPVTVRLISEEPQEWLSPGSLGTPVLVLDGELGAKAWKPSNGGTWRIEESVPVLESIGAVFDLERQVDLDAKELHTLEVTLASEYKVRLALSWARAGETLGEEAATFQERQLVLKDVDGRGDRQQKRFVFDLRSHAEWADRITGLRLRLIPARAGDPIRLLQLRGLRQELSPDVLAEASRRPWKVELDQEIRSAFLVPPGHPVEREVRVPEAGVLHFAVGTTGRLSAPMTLSLFAERLGSPQEVIPEMLFETRLEPVAGDETRTWQLARVDLSAFSSERLRLRVASRADAGREASFGFPVWANPEIVAASERPSRPDILLISVDTLRADRLSIYGPAQATSPRIDAWAGRHATVFENAIASAPWTLPSHSSLLSGLDALTHGVNHPFQAAPESLTTLAERLRSEGYFTAALTGGAWLHPHYGLAQGFDRYRFWSGEQRGDRELEVHGALAENWLGELRRPFFLFFHTFDVHDFNAPHRKVRELRSGPAGSEAPSLDQLYDQAVRHMDQHVGGLLEALSTRGQAITVLTSDHGEDLGEDGVFGHGSLREQVLWVPMLIEAPDPATRGQRIVEQTRSVDLMPTLLDLAGLETPSGLDGVSLRDLLEGRDAEVPSVAASYFSVDHGLSLRLRNRWKYLYDPSAWAPGRQVSDQEAFGRDALFELPGGESWARDRLASDHPMIPRLAAQARQLLAEGLAGLRLRIDNASSAPFAGLLRGDWLEAVVPKKLDGSDLWLTPAGQEAAGRDAARFSLAPDQTLDLLFERTGTSRFELLADLPVDLPVDDPAEASRRLTIDLEALSMPAAFHWTGSRWQAVTAESSSADIRVILEWRHASGDGDASPYEQNPELRRQLEALGYLE